MRIAYVEPAFEARARVAWCRPRRDGGGYEVGVSFLDAEDVFRARMVAQVCYIEDYRRSIARAEGRELSSEEAAGEWIAKYAHNFRARAAASSRRRTGRGAAAVRGPPARQLPNGVTTSCFPDIPVGPADAKEQTMKWEGQRESDNVEDLRDQGGGGGGRVSAASASATSASARS